MQQCGTTDITQWLAWFLDCLLRSIKNADKHLDTILFKSRLWEFVNQHSINEHQRLVINRMLALDFEGYINTAKYAKLVKCSKDTAFRDIHDLKERRIFVQNPSGGRSTSYRLVEDI